MDVRAKQRLCLLACPLNSELRGGGFAPRHLKRCAASCYNQSSKIMKQILLTLFLIFAFTIPSFAQNDWHTYPVRTIAELIEATSGDSSKKADLIISANPFPSKTKATYTGKSRPISRRTKDFIKLWTETRNVPASNADMLVEEFLFREQNREYWIPVIKKLVPFFGKELKEGDEIVIYYFFLGGYDEAKLVQKDSSLSEKEKKEAASKATGKIEWIFAVEEFQKLTVKPQTSAYLDQPLSAAVDNNLKVSGKKGEFLLDTRQVKSKSKVIFTGEIREAGEKKMRFLKVWAESQGHPLGVLQLLSQEARFREGDKDYWLPIRKKIADDMAAQLKKGDEVVIHTILAGGIPEANAVDWVFIVGEFSK
jgi:molybdopterin converting factor small subunit